MVIACIAASGCSNASVPTRGRPSPHFSPQGPSASGTRFAPTLAAGGPWSESLSWTGSVSGTLTEAYGTCHTEPSASPPLDSIALSNASGTVSISIPRHNPTPAVVQLPQQGFAGNVSLYAPIGEGADLFLPTAGLVTYAAGGDSGSLDVMLAAQGAHGALGAPYVQLRGSWTCA